MKKTICLLAFVVFMSGVTIDSIAQGPCESAVQLTDVSDFCSAGKAFNNTMSVPSNYGAAACWANAASTQDVWIKFTAIGTDVQIAVITGTSNGTIKNANLALVVDCISGNQLECTKSTSDTTRLYKGGLTPGADYYLRVASTTAEAGTFKLCIDSYNPPLNPQADCDAAVKLCDKSPIHIAGLSGIGTKPDETVGEGTCFGNLGEHNNCWYYWVCGTSGTLTFDLKPNDGVSDIDFVLYSINSGSNICSGRTVERCSATSCLNPGGMTGLNLTDVDLSEKMNCDMSLPAADRNGYVRYLDMIAGKTYALLINNAKTNAGFTIDFGGTGKFKGPIAQITADTLSVCEGQSILYTSNSSNYTSLEWNFISGDGTPSNPTGTGPHTVGYNKPGKFVAILNAKTPECISTDYLNITVNPMPTVTVASKEICAGNQDTLKAITSLKGGSYLWTPGASTDSSIVISPVKDTSYMVTYTKAGCSANAIANVNVIKLPVVTVNSETICLGSSATLNAIIKETVGIYSYHWSTGATTQSITVSPTVNTSYTVTVTSVQGCIAQGVGVVTLGNTLSVHAGNDTTVCEGATINFQVKPNGAGYVYKWFASNGMVSNPFIYNPTSNPVMNTTYFVEVINDKGCKGWDSVSIFLNPPIAATLSTTAASCKGVCDGKIAVSASGGTSPYSYNWTGGSTTAACTQLCAGIYTVTVTDKNGCHINADTIITEPPPLDLQTTSISSNCGKPTGSATVSVSGGTVGTGYTYIWNDPDKQTTATAINLINKQYCVTVTDGNGCKATACLVVSNKAGTTASLVSTTAASCYGNCNGSAEVTVVGGVAPYSYSWNTSPVQTTAKATGLCAGAYIVTVTDNTGCIDTVQVTITQPSSVTIDLIAPITNCIGNVITIKAIAHGGDGFYKYNWKPELTDTTASVIVSPLVTTVYHVVVKDGKGCASAQVAITVNVSKPVKVVASDDYMICPKDSVKISASASGGTGVYTYTWYPGAKSGKALYVKPLITTTYTVSVLDSCGIVAAIDSVKISVSSLPTVQFIADTVKGCSPLKVRFTDSSIVSGAVITKWHWDFGDGTFSDKQHPTHVFVYDKLKGGYYSVTLTVTSIYGCKATLRKQQLIQTFAMPVAGFDAPESISMLDPLVHFTNNSVGATNWTWSFGDSLATSKDNKSILKDPDHIYSDVGQYCVKLLVKNEGGCMDSTIHCLTIDPQFVLYIPNAFTPNDDGDNDAFSPKGEHIQEFEIRIFNRWGVMVYYSTDISTGWNGKLNNVGEEIPQDLYVYQIFIKDSKLKKHHYTGTITLIKGS